MRLASYAFVTAIAVAMGSGSAVADEQTKQVESAPQPTVMSDEELDQVVGAGADTFNRVIAKVEVNENNVGPVTTMLLLLLSNPNSP